MWVEMVLALVAVIVVVIAGIWKLRQEAKNDE